ncbi:unnamed protein product [Eretmochelys imbricata]
MLIMCDHVIFPPLLGVGVDDMFIIICWQQTDVKSKEEKQMAETYAEAAVSITITTTLTYVLAFNIGMMTSFQSVTSFCLYTGTAFLFCCLYNTSFFASVLT